jgi:hypothetical protein
MGSEDAYTFVTVMMSFWVVVFSSTGLSEAGRRGRKGNGSDYLLLLLLWRERWTGVRIENLSNLQPADRQTDG